MGFSRVSVGFLCFASAGLWTNPAHAECSRTLESYGIVALPANPQINKMVNLPDGFTGLVVAAVDPNSDASRQGVARGDGIVTINYQTVPDITKLTSVLCGIEERRNAVLLQIRRGILSPTYLPVRKSANNNDTSWLAGSESVAAAPHQSANPPKEGGDGATRLVAIEGAKRKCSELGFTPGTEKFGQCVLKVSE